MHAFLTKQSVSEDFVDFVDKGPNISFCKYQCTSLSKLKDSMQLTALQIKSIEEMRVEGTKCCGPQAVGS